MGDIVEIEFKMFFVDFGNVFLFKGGVKFLMGYVVFFVIFF